MLAEYERVTRSELLRLGLDRQLNLDMNGDFRQMAPALHRFLHDIEDAPVPAGLPIFGESPSEERLLAAIGAYLFAAYPQTMHDDVEELIPEWSKAFAAGQDIDTEDLTPEIAGIVTRVAEGSAGVDSAAARQRSRRDRRAADGAAWTASAVATAWRSAAQAGSLAERRKPACGGLRAHSDRSRLAGRPADGR